MAETQRHVCAPAGSSVRLGTTQSSLILRVPARPESLPIVRLVLMSCGAAAGLSLSEIFARSQDAIDAFTDILIAGPSATSIVIRANPDVTELVLSPADEMNSEASA